MFITSITLFADFFLIEFSLALLFKKSPFREANRFFALAVVFMVLCNVSMVVLDYSRNNGLLLSWYSPVHLVFAMLIAPVVYLYVTTLFGSSRLSWKKKLPVLALPVLPALAFMCYFYSLPIPVRISRFINFSISTHWMVIVLKILFFIESGFYLMLCLLKVRKLRSSGYLLKVNGSQTNIRWIGYFCGIELVGLLIYMLFGCFHIFSSYRTMAALCILSIPVICLTIKLQWSSGVFMQFMNEVSPDFEPRLKLDQQQVDEYHKRLLETMETSRIFLAQDCTLLKVASESNIPVHHLSHVINSHIKTNFSGFINQYRVNHACTLLSDKQKQNITLEAIAEECGFRSRTSLYRAFIKQKGIPPTEYQSYRLQQKKVS